MRLQTFLVDSSYLCSFILPSFSIIIHNLLQGTEVVAHSILQINQSLVEAKKAKKKTDANGTPAVVVISSEGIRIVESATRDVMHNVVIKAISYSTEVRSPCV